MTTVLALGPIPVRLPTLKLGRERIPPNFAQLCVCRTVPPGPTRSTGCINLLDEGIDSLGQHRGRSESVGEGLRVLVCIIVSNDAPEILCPAVARMAILVLLVEKRCAGLCVLLVVCCVVLLANQPPKPTLKTLSYHGDNKLKKRRKNWGLGGRPMCLLGLPVLVL
jgi:hypothetical protein